MKAEPMKWIPAILVSLGVGAMSAQAELIDFEEPTYSDATPGPALNGQDGWTADSGWILGDGSAAPNTTQVMRNDGADGVSYTAERKFATPLSAGVLSYDIRPAASSTEVSGQPAHWLLPQGSNGAWLFQLLTFSDSGFAVRGAGGGSLGNSGLTDIEFSSGDAWYNIEAVFDIADVTAGANGTYDVEITRLDGAFAGTVVWDIDDLAIANAVPDLENFRIHGSYAGAGHDTLIDNINYVPEPASLVLLGLGGLCLLSRRRSRR